MSDAVSTPVSSPLAPLTPISHSSSQSPSPEEIPKGFLAVVLSESLFVVQLEKWADGERIEIRLFIPHPEREQAFIELDRGTAKKGGWEWGWAHIKLRCEHERTLFVVKMLERVGREGKRKREIEVENEDEYGNEQSVLGSEDGEVEVEGTKASYKREDEECGDVEVGGYGNDRSDI